MRKLQRARRLVAFLAEVEHAEHNPSQAPQGVTSKLEALKKRQKVTRKAIKTLMKRIERGDPISGRSNAQVTMQEAQVYQQAGKGLDSLQATTKLMDASNKEDKARILQAASGLAEKKMLENMHEAVAADKDDAVVTVQMQGKLKGKKMKGKKMKGKKMKGKKMKGKKLKSKKLKVRKQAAESTESKVVMPELGTAKHDLSAPLSKLHRKLSKHIGKRLGKLLKLFKKRHSQHKMLSLKENRRVNAQLRSMAALLMKKHVEVEEAAKAKAAKAKAAKAKAAAAAAATAAAKEEEAQDQQHTSPAGISPAVQDFVQNTLSHQPANTPAASSLADLLHMGVRLKGGGMLHFVVPKEA